MYSSTSSNGSSGADASSSNGAWPGAKLGRQLLGKMAPGATKMIRMDHSHVMLTFHQFNAETSPSRKQAIIDTACVALEIHATLEEEIFYPALREVAPDHEVLQKAPLDHAEMKALIARLREMPADDPARDVTFLELMRDVIHHVADEETLLLPLAEQLLGDRLGELGAQMSARRMQLAAPHAGELAMNSVRTLPPAALALAGGMLVGGFLLARATTPRD